MLNVKTCGSSITSKFVRNVAPIADKEERSDAWKIKQVGPNEISVKLPRNCWPTRAGRTSPEVLARAIVKWLRENPGAGPGTRCGIRCATGRDGGADPQPGRYRIQVWHPGNRRERIKMHVARRRRHGVACLTWALRTETAEAARDLARTRNTEMVLHRGGESRLQSCVYLLLRYPRPGIHERDREPVHRIRGGQRGAMRFRGCCVVWGRAVAVGTPGGLHLGKAEADAGGLGCGYASSLITNATLLTDELAEELLASGILPLKSRWTPAVPTTTAVVSPPSAAERMTASCARWRPYRQVCACSLRVNMDK